LIGVLVTVPCAGVALLSLARGQPSLARIPLAILGFFVCCGLAIVGFLNLVFKAQAEHWLTGLLCFLIPGYVLVFAARRWPATQRPLLAHTSGLVGFILWGVFVPPYLTAHKHPGGQYADALAELPAGQQAVQLIVTNVPDENARGVIQEQLKEMAQESGITGSSALSRSGEPDRYQFWPVPDPQGFVAKIAFGRVKRISGRQFLITADPVSPEAIAAFKARNLRP
jgi:hypothetical protein